MEEDNLPIISHAACEYTIDSFHINGQRREEGSLIRKLFLPQTTHGAKMFLVCRNFVFNHYDIEYDTSEFAGSDVVQLKRDKSILVTRGQLDEVPPGRREMEKTMELQWLAALTPTQLSSDPELFVQKRFLDRFGALAPYKLDARKLVTVEYSSSQGDLMILSPSLRSLHAFYRQKWGDDVPEKAREYESDPEDNSDDEEAGTSGCQPGSKRLAPAGSVRARKQAKRARVPLKYHVLLRYRETRTGVIHYRAEGGMLKFVDEEQLEFSARIDLSPYLGLKVELAGRKVCDLEEVPTDKWRDFTRARYDHELAARLQLL